MKERTLKLVLEYDGTGFYGWQIQLEKRTVQGVVEEALAKILRHFVRIIAAGRTDAGVHASGKVASFQINHIATIVMMIMSVTVISPRWSHNQNND